MRPRRAFSAGAADGDDIERTNIVGSAFAVPGLG
jgi:hypothetical protein